MSKVPCEINLIDCSGSLKYHFRIPPPGLSNSPIIMLCGKKAGTQVSRQSRSSAEADRSGSLEESEKAGFPPARE
jgi:hypothetical protein